VDLSPPGDGPIEAPMKREAPGLGLPTPPLAGSKAGGARSRYWST